MPIRRANRKRRVVRKRRPARRSRAGFARSGRSHINNPMGQYGTVTETITLPDPIGNTPELWDTRLQDYPRSVAVTALYQFYRLKYVEYRYIPKYPLGTQGDPTGTEYGRPMRLFYMMNRQGTNPATLSLTNFEEKGCKPIPFGDSRARAAVVKYVPNLLQVITSGAQDTVAPTSESIVPVFKKWINRYYTDNSVGPDPGPDVANTDVRHWGHLSWVDDYNESASQVPVGEMRVTAVWEYKNPYMPATTSPFAKSVVSKKPE